MLVLRGVGIQCPHMCERLSSRGTGMRIKYRSAVNLHSPTDNPVPSVMLIDTGAEISVYAVRLHIYIYLDYILVEIH